MGSLKAVGPLTKTATDQTTASVDQISLASQVFTRSARLLHRQADRRLLSARPIRVTTNAELRPGLDPSAPQCPCQRGHKPVRVHGLLEKGSIGKGPWDGPGVMACEEGERHAPLLQSVGHGEGEFAAAQVRTKEGATSFSASSTLATGPITLAPCAWSASARSVASR